MFCNQCGQANSNDAKFCSSCGNKLEIKNIQAVHTSPQLEKTESSQPRKKQIELWNPNAAANWSLLFTPIFGSYLQMKNWQALGKPEDANTAKNWIIFTIIFILFINFATPFIWDDVEKVTTISRGLGFWYIIIWYFAYAKKQPKYVKEKLNDNYQKKSWIIPLISAVVILFIIVFLDMVLGSSIDQQTTTQTAQQASNQPAKTGQIDDILSGKLKFDIPEEKQKEYDQLTQQQAVKPWEMDWSHAQPYKEEPSQQQNTTSNYSKEHFCNEFALLGLKYLDDRLSGKSLSSVTYEIRNIFNNNPKVMAGGQPEDYIQIAERAYQYPVLYSEEAQKSLIRNNFKSSMYNECINYGSR